MVKGMTEFQLTNANMGSNARQYELSDLVDLTLLLKLLDAHYTTTKAPYGIIDAENNILGGKGWQDICTRFHRMCPMTEHGCNQSDSYLNRHLMEGIYMGHKCPNGLMDYAAPIIVEGQ